MESKDPKEKSSAPQPAGSAHGEKRSPVLAVVVIETTACRSQSVRAADELSDEEADAFFFA